MATKKKTVQRAGPRKTETKDMVIAMRMDRRSVARIDDLAGRDLRKRGGLLRKWVVERLDTEIAKEAAAKA